MPVFFCSYEVGKTDRADSMPAAIFATPIQVDGRLSEFGITKDQLLEVVYAMVAARAECTDNDPPSAPGWSSWRHGTRRAREVFRSDVWLKDDTDQLPTIVNHSIGMRIAVANTDDGTGIIINGIYPQNRSKKGAATDRAVDLTQSTLFGEMGETDDTIVKFIPRDRHSDSIATFYVCVFNEGEEVRAEFSCPIRVVNGFFVGFSERIILVGPGEWPPRGKTTIKRDDDTGTNDGDYDIPVRRK